MKKNLNESGFTLLELLIVIGVIAILASIIIPSYRGMITEGDITAAQGEVKTLGLAIENYYLHNDHTYPTYITDLLTATPRLIKDDIPKDRFNRTDVYQYSNLGSYFITWTNGPNEKMDISVDIGNQKVVVPKASDDIFETNLRTEKQ